MRSASIRLEVINVSVIMGTSALVFSVRRVSVIMICVRRIRLACLRLHSIAFVRKVMKSIIQTLVSTLTSVWQVLAIKLITVEIRLGVSSATIKKPIAIGNL